MSAQIRPNRMEVTDRFPMLGFAVRADEANVNAEVVLATDIGLFQQQNRTSRTAANFYSSREHGALKVPRGEGVFVVPPEVLARFIGSDKLYFGLATGPIGNGGLHVDAVPREGSPYVALRGFTGRTLRRSFGSGRTIVPPVLEWAGDVARPGTEPSNGGPAVTGNGNGPTNGYTNGHTSTAPAAMAAYDDGFGEMPVLPVLPGDQRNRAQRIGGAFGDRIGEALDLGLSPQSVDPLLNVLEPRATPAPMGYARSKAVSGSGGRRAPAPLPRSRAMDGGVGVAVAIGGFVVETIRDSRGDISWDLDQFRGIKHPNDTAPANPGAFRDAPTINLDDWPVWEGVDDISAWFKIDWQYNGTSLGNVRITNTGTNDAVGFSLHVTARIMDDNQVYEGGCGALRLTFHYRFDRSIGSEGIAIRDITLYGDGTHAIDGRWLQSSTFAREQRARARTKAADTNGVRQARPPAPRARAMDGGAGVAIAIGGFVVETIRDSRGDISWDLDQFRGIKHPNDTAPANPGAFRDAPTINLDDWPVWEGVDDISAWFKIDWQYNGTSLGNVRITNTGTNDAVGFSLHVTAKIMDDNQVYEGGCGALRLTFHYRFDRSIGSEGIAIRDVTLYGDGTHAIDGRWLQSSTFAREQRARRARA